MNAVPALGEITYLEPADGLPGCYLYEGAALEYYSPRLMQELCTYWASLDPTELAWIAHTLDLGGDRESRWHRGAVSDLHLLHGVKLRQEGYDARAEAA